MRGFTLVELMVTVSILGIFAVLAVPSYRNTIANQRAKAASTDLYLYLLKARSEAIKRNRSVQITPVSTRWEAGWSIPDPSSAGATINAHGSTPGVTVRAQDQTSDPATVVYLGSGRVQAASASATPYFIVTSTTVNTIQYCVSVNLSGLPYAARGTTC